MPRWTSLPRFAACMLISAFLCGLLHSAERIERPDLATMFDRHGVVGTFALYDVSKERVLLVNPGRATERKIPASTFKIANSLIALEIGVVADENYIIPYGGRPQPIKHWERDMSMRDAIAISNVPVYQELARRIGKPRYEQWLKRLDYGNREIGANVETFWLEGPLAISTVEQVRFLARLARKALPVSERAQSIVADIIKLEVGSRGTLFGKTGWSNTPSPDIGWFVGWVESERGVFAFALNMDIRSRDEAKLRKTIALELLAKLGLF